MWWIIFAIINVAVFILYGIDKYKAVNKKWRISEAALIVSAIFGPIGAILGMLAFRHKIRKPKFYLGVPAILLIEAALVWYFVLRH